MRNQPVVVAGEPSPAKELWLYSEGKNEPYLHLLDGNCECFFCESQIRRIIYPVAA